MIFSANTRFSYQLLFDSNNPVFPHEELRNILAAPQFGTFMGELGSGIGNGTNALLCHDQLHQMPDIANKLHRAIFRRPGLTRTLLLKARIPLPNRVSALGKL